MPDAGGREQNPSRLGADRPANGEGAGAGASPAPRRRRRIAPDAEFQRWLAKYEPVERAMIEERARRIASAERRRMKRRLAFAAECEATEGLAKALARNGRVGGGPRRRSGGRGRVNPGRSGTVPLARIGGTGLHVLDGGIASVLLSVLGVACTRDVDAMRHRLKRPIYYARENARRRALAAERRKVVLRETTNPCPTREEVLDAWTHAKDSREAMLRFGGMMEDLECYVDNSLRFGRTGEVVGRAPGIKGWLQMNIPVLYSKYKTVMRYKAAAKKLRQVVGLRDPVPVSAILPAGEGGKKTVDGRGGQARDANEILMRTKSNGENCGEDHGVDCEEDRKADYGEDRGEDCGEGQGVDRGMDGGLMVVVLRARAMFLEAMDGVPDNATRTAMRLDELLDPERVEDATMLKAWRERYENEITMRTKSRWFGRLFAGIGKKIGKGKGLEKGDVALSG